MKSIVLVDSGSTNIKLANLSESGELFARFSTRSEDVAVAEIERRKADSVFVADVRLNQSLFGRLNSNAINARDYASDFPITFAENLDMGIDRKLACIVAAQRFCGPVIVVGCGTALTISMVEENNCNFSVIAAGLEISAAALEANTRLRFISDDNFPSSRQYPQSLTESCCSGLYWSHIFAIEGWVKFLNSNLNQKANLVISGGYAEVISRDLSIKSEVMSEACLAGLAILVQNKPIAL